MIKFIINLIIPFGIFLFQGSSAAKNPSNILYVNGIQNTIEDAKKTALIIQKILNESNNREAKDKILFKVNYVWNPIGWNKSEDGSDLEEDLYELFWLKDSESINYQNFYALREVFSGNLNTNLVTDDIIVNSAKAITDNIIGEMRPSVKNPMGPFVDTQHTPPFTKTRKYLPLEYTYFAIQEIREKIQNDNELIVIAHSQGNLLVNLALANVVASKNYKDYLKVRIINIANTSSFSLSGLNFTHAGDAALFKDAAGNLNSSLEKLPSRKKWLRTSDDCKDDPHCDFMLAPYTFGIPTSDSRKQGFIDSFLDHSIIETYLSNDTLEYVSDAPMVFINGAKRFVDRFEDYVYAAANGVESIVISTASCDVDPESGLINWAVSGVAVSKSRFASIVPVTTGLNRKDFLLSSSTSRCVGWGSILYVEYGGGPYCSREATDDATSSWVVRYTTPPGVRTIKVASVISSFGLHVPCDFSYGSEGLCQPFFFEIPARDAREMPECPGFVDFTGVAR